MFSNLFEISSKTKLNPQETKKPSIHDKSFGEDLSLEQEVQTVGSVPQQPDSIVKNKIQEKLDVLKKLTIETNPTTLDPNSNKTFK